MGDRTRAQALYLALESGGFAVDPDSDGSDYVAVKTISGIGFVQNTTPMLTGNYHMGRNRPTRDEPGPDGCTIEYSVPVQGLVAAAGDGVLPAASSATDWLDIILASAFGTGAEVSGEGVASAAAGTLVLDQAQGAAQDLLPVWESGLNTPNTTQWRRSTDLTTATHTVTPNWSSTPTGGAVLYGTRTYQPPTNTGGGYTCSAYVVQDQIPYYLAGGRPSSMKISLPAGGMATMSVSMMFDSMTQTSRGSIDAFAAIAGTPIKGMLSPLSWGGTAYACKKVEIDFGLTTNSTDSTAGTNGRANIEVISAHPIVTIEPAYATNWQTDFKAGTERTLMIQLGGGIVSGGVLNSCCFFAEAAQIMEAPNGADDGGRIRQPVKLKVVDGGVFTGSTIARHWSFARA